MDVLEQPIGMYHVQKLLPGNETWWTICECDSPESVAEVIRILLKFTAKTTCVFQVRFVE